MAALAGIAGIIQNIIMIFQPGIAVQAGMHKRQVIGLTVILYRQLPVTPHFQLKIRISPTEIHICLKFSPSLPKCGGLLFKGGGIPGQVHINHIPPDR